MRTGYEPRPASLWGKYADERARWPENEEFWRQVQILRAATYFWWVDGRRFQVRLGGTTELDIAVVTPTSGGHRGHARPCPVRHDGAPLLTSIFWGDK